MKFYEIEKTADLSVDPLSNPEDDIEYIDVFDFEEPEVDDFIYESIILRDNPSIRKVEGREKY